MQYTDIDKLIAYLKSIDDRDNLYLVCKAIAPDSIAKYDSKSNLIETVEDCLLSRL